MRELVPQIYIGVVDLNVAIDVTQTLVVDAWSSIFHFMCHTAFLKIHWSGLFMVKGYVTFQSTRLHVRLVCCTKGPVLSLNVWIVQCLFLETHMELVIWIVSENSIPNAYWLGGVRPVLLSPQQSLLLFRPCSKLHRVLEHSIINTGTLLPSTQITSWSFVLAIGASLFII